MYIVLLTTRCVDILRPRASMHRLGSKSMITDRRGTRRYGLHFYVIECIPLLIDMYSCCPNVEGEKEEKKNPRASLKKSRGRGLFLLNVKVVLAGLAKRVTL
jgi:hypothetical protein